MTVAEAAEVLDPSKKAWAGSRRPALVAQAVDVGSRCVDSAKLSTEDKKEDDEDYGYYKGGNKGRNHAREGIGFGLVHCAGRLACILLCSIRRHWRESWAGG